MLASADEVLALRPRLASESGLEIGVVGRRSARQGRRRRAHGAGAEPAFEVRAFFPAPGGVLAEDPVTGSLNAGLAQWLIGDGLAPPRYVAAQGAALGRAGRVHVATAKAHDDLDRRRLRGRGAGNGGALTRRAALRH